MKIIIEDKMKNKKIFIINLYEKLKDNIFQELGFDLKKHKIKNLIFDDKEKEYIKNYNVIQKLKKDKNKWNDLLEYAIRKIYPDINFEQIINILNNFTISHLDKNSVSKTIEIIEKYEIICIKKHKLYKDVCFLFSDILQDFKHKSKGRKTNLKGVDYKKILKFAKRIDGSIFVYKSDCILIFIPKNINHKKIFNLFKKHFYNKYRDYSEIWNFAF